MSRQDNQWFISRRAMLKTMAAAAGCVLLPVPGAIASDPWKPTLEDEAFLDDLQRQGCLFFWEQGSANTGQVLDRARNNLTGGRDPRRMASIAATGFGLTALCIADHRGYLPHAQIVERVKTTLAWHLNTMPEVHGFFYHFTDIETGERFSGAELSSVDTTILLCGMLMARAYFQDPQIQSMAQQIYERVEWPWMLNGGKAFSMGWHPESGFLENRWDHYCELMMIDLLAIGSPTHPVAPEYWNNFTRSVLHYGDFSYISGDDPLFTHQYSQAWFDFRGKRDKYADYFQNSVTATEVHRRFCLELGTQFPDYSDDLWGITASDSEHGYVAWGGPPAMGPIDGSVVPSAAGGSLPFLPAATMRVLKTIRNRYPSAWSKYGFVNAFNPLKNWYDSDVIGIDTGIVLLMAENLRTGFVWETFMKTAEAQRGMERAGFHKY
jgi:hypothetical protein